MNWPSGELIPVTVRKAPSGHWLVYARWEQRRHSSYWRATGTEAIALAASISDRMRRLGIERRTP